MTQRAPVICYVGIGSNLDDPLGHVQRAIRDIGDTPGIEVLRCSRRYHSKAVGPGQQPDYVNSVIEIRTDLDPHALLRVLQQIETRHGRTREIHWGPRTLDLDILLYGDLQLSGPALTVPHPRLGERAFVLKPLADLCPERQMLTPKGKKSETIAALLTHLPQDEVWPIAGEQVTTGSGKSGE